MRLRMFLDFKLNFQDGFENMLSKINKTVALLRKLQSTLPEPSLMTISKPFVRVHLDYDSANTLSCILVKKYKCVQSH